MSSSEKLPFVDPRLKQSLERPRNGSRGCLPRLLQAVALFYCVYYVARLHFTSWREDAKTLVPDIGVPSGVQKLWGPYSPWHPAGRYVQPPQYCKITQVNILQRHGARYPTDGDGERYQKSIERLASARKFYETRLEFLKDYVYDLGEDVLIPVGARQSFESGEIAFGRYGHLLQDGEVPFVRASSKPRVVSSAGNWTVGFAAASHQRVNPTVNGILSEAVNNTLQNDCPNAKEGKAEMKEWLSVFAPPLVKRLNEVAPGADLKEEDVFNIMAACPFESLAKQSKSPFCDLFTKDEFKAFEYHGDVEKYYKTGYGNPFGPVQGVGYVNELLARLTNSPVDDHTTFNDSLPFPLDKTLYADFSHENLLVAVYSVIGLFNISNPVNPHEMPDIGRKKRTWVASKMVPFSGRMATERLECRTEQFVRVFVNDALQPLEFCGGDKNGLCRLEAFVDSQGYARRSGDGDFEKCYN